MFKLISALLFIIFVISSLYLVKVYNDMLKINLNNEKNFYEFIKTKNEDYGLNFEIKKNCNNVLRIKDLGEEYNTGVIGLVSSFVYSVDEKELVKYICNNQNTVSNYSLYTNELNDEEELELDKKVQKLKEGYFFIKNKLFFIK